ncbi:Asp-tRNA(Asn)/Glu-tRNA(Gln) amidotransferase subunit GatC [Candidatus Dojkabacteria bacterium]|uniref:Aspartyl/glutamyl-tRNA(Asn/Gln) amidotransferase subunit C n=1 Tax=Candidatus Dojkabacteria bacterium TaxID=2099670 RepID=A0A955HYZ4_9BACT|nr:Asp-tRNA(Asn)/Glu-tRNA(Gln) amidotransferase subunit GatC [Candidatus Dojkabacteria bacterium]
MASKKHSKLTKEQVLRLAKLLKLEISDSELEKIQFQLSETLDYIDNLSELDVNNVEPTSHTGNSKNVTFSDGTRSERTLSQKDALSGSKNISGGMFSVNKILDK